MGFGSAMAQIAVQEGTVYEETQVTIVRGPTREGHLALLFYVDGAEPVSAQIVFPGLLLPAPAPFGGAVSLDVPLVPSWPEGPYVAIVKLRSTLGPEHLTYYEHVRGRVVPYNPQGVLLPKVCPRGGFRFAGTFTFLDGSRATAKTAVPCPVHRAMASSDRNRTRPELGASLAPAGQLPVAERCDPHHSGLAVHWWRLSHPDTTRPYKPARRARRSRQTRASPTADAAVSGGF
jgi:hypothetical protein